MEENGYEKTILYEKDDVRICDYSEKCHVIFVNKEFGKQHSEKLKTKKFRYNPNLTYNKEKIPGWVIPKKTLPFDDLIDFLNDL
jgi:hypothetical protein